MNSIWSSSSEFRSLNVGVILPFVLLGGATTWLIYKMREGHFGYISEDTRVCLRKSSVVAALSMVLGSLPIAAMRKLGWKMFEPLYTNFFFQNRYTSVLTVVFTLLLAVFTVLFPAKKNKSFKYGLWGSTCITVGSLLAPIVFTPRDLLTIASGYTISLTLPTIVACSVSPNFLVLNGIVLLLTGLGTTFAHHIGIPWVIQRRHAIAGTIPKIPTGLLSTLLLGTVLITGLIMMFHTNYFVWWVQKAHEDKQQKKKITTSIRGVSRNKELSDPSKDTTALGWDGTDEVTNGLVLAGYSVYVFLSLFWDTLAMLKSLPTRKKKKESDS